MSLKYTLPTSSEEFLTVVTECITYQCTFIASQDLNYIVNACGISPSVGTRNGGGKYLNRVNIATLEWAIVFWGKKYITAGQYVEQKKVPSK